MLTSEQQSLKRPKGFTIVELMTVVAIIGLLTALLFPALRSFRNSARQTTELNAARQLIAAYINYAAVHNDNVLPGYGDMVPFKDGTSPSRQLRAYGPDKKEIAGGQLDTARKRYLWRLAPYLDYNLRGLYSNENQELLERLERQNYADYIYKATLAPSLGLNSDWLGGDSGPPDAAGFVPPNSPLRKAVDYNHFYLVSMGQARTPNMLMVFGSARGKDPDDAVTAIDGWYKISSPYFTAATGYRWSAEFNKGDDPIKYGYLAPRYDGNIAAGFLGGNTGVLNTQQVKDMRYWANWATAADWRLPLLNQ